MSYAHEQIRRYYERTGRPGSLDAAYQYETTVLTELLTRLEVVLEDEGVDRATIERVIRCMLYGSPSPAAAQMRMEQQEQIVELMQQVPPAPMVRVTSTPDGPRAQAVRDQYVRGQVRRPWPW